MLYSDRVSITANTTNDTDSATVNLTLNGKAARILYVWALTTKATNTAAEGKILSVFATGDIDKGGSPRPLIPMTAGVGSGLGGDRRNAFVPASFHPVDWTTTPNGVITLGVRGLGGGLPTSRRSVSSTRTGKATRLHSGGTIEAFVRPRRG